MYDIFVKLMVLAALLELGISLDEWESCRSRECLVQLEKKSRDVLKIDWKPISVFPQEARRFQVAPNSLGRNHD